MPAIAQGQGTPPVLNLPSPSPSGSPYLVVRTVIEVIDIREDDPSDEGPSTSCRTLDDADPCWSTSSASTSASASTSQLPCTPTTPFLLGPSTRTPHTPFDFAAPAPTNLGSLAASPPPSVYPLTIFHPSSFPSYSTLITPSSSSTSSISALADSLQSSSSTSPPQSTTSRLSDNISKGPRGNVATISGAMVAAITVLSAIIVSIVAWYGCHRNTRNRSVGPGLGRDLRRTGFQGHNHDRRRNLSYEGEQTSGASGRRSGSSGRVETGGRRGGEGREAPEVRLAEVRSESGESGMHTEVVGSVSSAKGGSSR